MAKHTAMNGLFDFFVGQGMALFYLHAILHAVGFFLAGTALAYSLIVKRRNDALVKWMVEHQEETNEIKTALNRLLHDFYYEDGAGAPGHPGDLLWDESADWIRRARDRSEAKRRAAESQGRRR
jgi:hypothetical protein